MPLLLLVCAVRVVSVIVRIFLLRGQHKHARYHLSVRNSGEFMRGFMVLLWQVLRSKFWYMTVPKLPGKKLFFNFDTEFVERYVYVCVFCF
jgi:hypothetical protein